MPPSPPDRPTSGPPIKPDGSITACIRCGTCCLKGGPSFHLEDKALIVEGRILSRHLYTIRQGEPAYDNIRGRILPAASDIIKIKAPPGSSACWFFDPASRDCSIYAFRPLECRVLKCWDTEEIEGIYERNRLARKDLIADIGGLWELVSDHQERCAYAAIGRQVNALDRGQNQAALTALLSMLTYDREIRSLVVSKGALDSAMTDFLFGRPLVFTLGMYGLKVRPVGNTFHLTPLAPS